MLRAFVRALTASSLIVFLAVSGCQKPQPPEEKPAAVKPQGILIGVGLVGVDTPRRAQLKADIEAAAAKHPDWQLIVRAAGDSAERQKGHIEEFINTGVRAIILSPVDPQESAEAAAKAFDKGIPVIVVERPVIGEKYTSLIIPDWKRAGTLAGEWLASKLRGKGKIVELAGPVDAPGAQETHETFRAKLRDPGYHIFLESGVGASLPEVDPEELMRAALDHARDFDAVIAYDTVAESAWRAASAANRQKNALFVSVSSIPPAASNTRASKDSLVRATIIVPTGGIEAINVVAKLMHGEKPPKKIVPEIRVVTK
jgi:ribose transport system substrate-binding protein